MADARSSVDETYQNPNSDAPHGQVPAAPLRRDTVSSTGSDGYAPAPVGRWVLKIHGNCSRCHHQHTAVKIRVNVSHDTKSSRVGCEKCGERWLTFGGSNSTQISLLSTTTMEPDPVEKEVRQTLIKMIQSATTITAIASPTLARIPESTSTNALEESSASTSARPTPASRASATSGPVTSQTSAPLGQNGVPMPALATPSSRSTDRVRETRRSRYSISELKPRVTARFSAMQKFKFGKLFRLPNSKKTQPSSKSLGKLPMDSPLPEDPPMQEPQAADPVPAQAADSTTHKKRFGHPVVQPGATDPHAPGPSNQHREAAHFLETLKNEMLEFMDKNERVKWARQKYTQFRAHRVNSTPLNDTSMVDNRTQVSATELPPVSHTESQRHLDSLVLGSSSGLMDEFERPLGTHGTSSAEETSESRTAVEDGSVVPHRLSGLRLEQELRRHGSPRPPSVNSQTLAWQQLRHPRAEQRRSFDSAATGDAGRSASSNRGRMNRRSRGSMGRASALGLNEMSLSQTSLHHHMEEEDGTNVDPENSPSSPPVPPFDHRRTSA